VRAGFDMGLDRSGMLAAATRDAYLRTLREAFLPRIAARLEQRLLGAERDHVELVYETLKAYLMLFGGRNFDANALRAYLHADWDATLPPSVKPEQREALRRHLDRLLATGEVGAPSHADARLVTNARAVVASVPLAQRAYQRLKQVDVGPEATPFSVETAGGAGAKKAFVLASGRPLSAGVPALYSRAVLRQSLRERSLDVLRQFAREESWVLGTTTPGGAEPAAQKSLAEDVQKLYLADYAARWNELVDDLQLAPTPNLAATAEQAALLARPDSPLVSLLRAVAREVTLTAPGEPARDDIAPLQAKFEPLARFVTGQPAPVDEALALLGQLATHLAAVEDAARRKALPPASDVTRELQAMSQRAPQPLSRMLAQLATTSGAQVFAQLREPLANQLANELAPACARVVANRYPFARGAGEEMSREDFARTFGAGGLVDGFFQRQLAPYVDTSARPWAWRKAEGGRGETSEALQQFQRAHQIRDAFFGDNGKRLGMRLDFRLLEMDPGANELVLDIDGQVMRFRPGAKDTQSVQWPGPGEGRVQVQLAPSSGSGYVFKGPWALFRLLDRVRMEPGGAPNRAVMVLDVEGRKARFDVRSAAASNPMLREDLEQFQCPRRL
jgi:type VI secretion system protein ImpL